MDAWHGAGRRAARLVAAVRGRHPRFLDSARARVCLRSRHRDV